MRKTLLILALSFSAGAQIFPTRVATDNDLLVAPPLGADTNLTASIGTTDTSIPVASSTSFVTNSVARIDNESVLICSVTTGTLTVCAGGRGYGSTAIAAHSVNARVWIPVGKDFHNNLKNEMIAVENALSADFNVVGGHVYLKPPTGSLLGGLKTIDCSSIGHVQKIDNTGTGTCSADTGGSGGGLGDPGANGIVKRTALNTTVPATSGVDYEVPLSFNAPLNRALNSISLGPISLSTGVTGLLPVANGGTGLTSPSLIGGANVTITGTWPNQTIAATGGGSGMANPMTTIGDLIVGGTVTSGVAAPARLAAGTSGYVLTSTGSGSAPSWQAATGGGASSVSQLSDFAPTVASGVLTVGGGNANNAGSVTTFGNSMTGTPAGSGTTSGLAYAYIDSNGVRTIGSVVTVTVVNGTFAAGISAFPVGSIPLARCTITSNSFDTAGCTDLRAAFHGVDIQAGSNVTVSYASGHYTIASTATGGGGSMVYPAAGVPTSTGTAWGSSLTAPSGAIVGTTDTQTLTNKTIDGVSPATMAFVDPTSSIQTQLDAKAPTASPTFTGTATAANLTVTGTCTGCGGGGGATAWSALTAPAGNLSLGMASNTSLFTWGATTGTANLFSLLDTASNTGTGYVATVGTATGSAANPLRVNCAGVTCLQVTKSTANATVNVYDTLFSPGATNGGVLITPASGWSSGNDASLCFGDCGNKIRTYYTNAAQGVFYNGIQFGSNTTNNLVSIGSGNTSNIALNGPTTISSNLTVTGTCTGCGGGSPAWTGSAKTANYTIATEDTVTFTSASAVTATLPASPALWYRVSIVNMGTGTLTVSPGTNNLNGSTTGIAISTQYGGITVQYVASGNWVVLH